ncbi:hypothetical protein RCH20_001534 [Psychrobacter sp. PL15]|uniref:hypothetical protein n=1 Tax=Psychrobacter sp. PL15 TaxID=3071719 RepID=UPI002E06FBDC|nr:hypothetical protein [Psychrobacter sp. PL15]
MQYTAIIKDGGLFIPNVFSDLNDGRSYIAQVEVDIEDVRKQLNSSEEPKKAAIKEATKEPKKQLKKQTPKQPSKEPQDLSLGTLQKSDIDELEALDDIELSEMLKAYMNDGQVPVQISLENL